MTPLLDHSAIKQKRRFVRKANLQNSQQRLFQVGLSFLSLSFFIPSDGEFFDLAHNGFLTCGIPDGDSFVLTGGLLHNFVTRFVHLGAVCCPYIGNVASLGTWARSDMWNIGPVTVTWWIYGGRLLLRAPV